MTGATSAEDFHARVGAAKDAPATAARAIPWTAWPDHHAVTRAGQDLFAALDGRPLSRVRLPRQHRLYNWGDDEAHLTDDGQAGLVHALDCFGALPGDGVDQHVHLLLADGTHATFHVGTDYTQPELTVGASGPSAERAVAAAVPILEALRESARR